MIPRKTTLRTQCSARIGKMTPREIENISEIITKTVLEHPLYVSAGTVFIYLSTLLEPGTDKIVSNALKNGKTVCVPKCLPNRKMEAIKITKESAFTENRFGIREPFDSTSVVPKKQIDLAIIPCVAASGNGARLGHGGGYYDIFLKESPCSRLCLCFDCNLKQDLPTEDHDEPMDVIITEKKTVVCR